MERIDINLIRMDGGTQPRAELNDQTIAEYAEAIGQGAEFPPVVVFYDGTDRWLADGFHRVHANRKAGRTEVTSDVRQGTCRDAKLFSAGANHRHGLPRSNADKRRSVLLLLHDEIWSRWSNREIARQCAVYPSFVDSIRSSSLPDTGGEPRKYTTRHGATAAMKPRGGTRHDGGWRKRKVKEIAEPEVVKAVEEGRISATQAIRIAEVEPPERQREIAAAAANAKNVNGHRVAMPAAESNVEQPMNGSPEQKIVRVFLDTTDARAAAASLVEALEPDFIEQLATELAAVVARREVALARGLSPYGNGKGH